VALDRTEWISLIICLTGLLVALLLIWMVVTNTAIARPRCSPPEPIKWDGETKRAGATMTSPTCAVRGGFL
jgi:hypothetical protein